MPDPLEDDFEDFRKTPEQQHQERLIKTNKLTAAYIEKSLKKNPHNQVDPNGIFMEIYYLPNHPDIKSLELHYASKGFHPGLGDPNSDLSALICTFKETSPGNYIIYRNQSTGEAVVMSRRMYNFYFDSNGKAFDIAAGRYTTNMVTAKEAARQLALAGMDDESNYQRPLTITDSSRIRRDPRNGFAEYNLQNYNYHEFILQAFDSLHELKPDQYPKFSEFAKSESADQTL